MLLYNCQQDRHEKERIQTLLLNAKLSDVKNDEFYTRLGDIEKELNEYDPAVFKDKVIFCNVDDRSCNCWRFFHMNFHRLGLKKLIASHCKMDGSPSYDMIYDNKNPHLPSSLFGDYIAMLEHRSLKNLRSKINVISIF